ncbi:hypothetical protein EDC04DRAFT_2669130 [Pisolithus marmoratus]|nr:hypothetical protein EDC04DRAFT_2669130 [Pisolithus marmoratus]
MVWGVNLQATRQLTPEDRRRSHPSQEYRHYLVLQESRFIDGIRCVDLRRRCRGTTCVLTLCIHTERPGSAAAVLFPLLSLVPLFSFLRVMQQRLSHYRRTDLDVYVLHTRRPLMINRSSSELRGQAQMQGHPWSMARPVRPSVRHETCPPFPHSQVDRSYYYDAMAKCEVSRSVGRPRFTGQRCICNIAQATDDRFGIQRRTIFPFRKKNFDAFCHSKSRSQVKGMAPDLFQHNVLPPDRQ